MDKTKVDKLISERSNDTQDSRILFNYSINDLDEESIKAFRNSFSISKPNHPFLGQDMQGFFAQIGVFQKDRDSNKHGLTLAGLLMFGNLSSILEEFPNYILDYQEQDSKNSHRRWEDRLTTDGSWSGNLFDFYRKVYRKLVSDLKIPFSLKEGQRVDETEVHEAIRESLVNAIIHADYNETSAILIKKNPGLFSFRNPGLMRISAEQAKKGGISDCRNRLIQKMFLFIGAGEQAGSGIPRIFQTWKKQHWHVPKIIENYSPAYTTFELRQLSLFSDDVINTLNNNYGEEKLKKTTELERLILATTFTEGDINHSRISDMCEHHPSDISKALNKLVRKNFLTSEGDGRGTHYKIFYQNNSEDLKASSEGLKASSEGLKASSEGLKASSEALQINSEGFSEEIFKTLIKISSRVRNKKKAPRSMVEETIQEMCKTTPLSLDSLSKLLERNPDFIRQSYIKSMIDANKLKPLFEDEPTHPKQAYKDI